MFCPLYFILLSTFFVLFFVCSRFAIFHIFAFCMQSFFMDYTNIRTQAISSEKVANDPQWKLISRLVEAETVLANDENPDFDNHLKAIHADSNFPKTRHNENQLEWYMRILYYDLFTDYHSLFAPIVSTPKLLDLVSKKLTVITNVPDNISLDPQLYHALLDPIFVKMAHYVILADGDFRRQGIIARLKELMPPVDPITSRCLQLVGERKFVPLDLWTHAMEVFDAPITRRLIKSHRLVLRYNHIETNILCLPRYYDNITIEKLPQLFNEDIANLESVVNSMIVSGKLPDGTRIDQLQNIIEFRDLRPASTNAKSARVCKMVDAITRMIE